MMKQSYVLRVGLLLLTVQIVAQTTRGQAPPPFPVVDYDAAQWKAFTTPDGTVTLSLPGIPSVTHSSLDAREGPFVAESHVLTTGFGQYGITLVDFSNRSTHPDFIRGFFDGFKKEKLTGSAKLLNEKDLDGFAVPGREFVITDEGAIGRYWVFHSSGRMYALWLLTTLDVTFKDGKPSSEQRKRSEVYETIASRFFGSLRLQPRTEARIPVKESNNELLQPVSVKRDLYPANADATKLIETALKSAATDNKRVVLIFGGNWCYDCHVLDQALHEGEAGKIVKESFLLVHVNIGEGDKNLDVLKKYDATLNFGVPVVVILDSSARVIYSSTKGEFEAARRMMKKDLVAFLNQWKAKAVNRP